MSRKELTVLVTRQWDSLYLRKVSIEVCRLDGLVVNQGRMFAIFPLSGFFEKRLKRKVERLVKEAEVYLRASW